MGLAKRPEVPRREHKADFYKVICSAFACRHGPGKTLNSRPFISHFKFSSRPAAVSTHFTPIFQGTDFQTHQQLFQLGWSMYLRPFFSRSCLHPVQGIYRLLSTRFRVSVFCPFQGISFSPFQGISLLLPVFRVSVSARSRVSISAHFRVSTSDRFRESTFTRFMVFLSFDSSQGPTSAHFRVWIYARFKVS